MTTKSANGSVFRYDLQFNIGQAQVSSAVSWIVNIFAFFSSILFAPQVFICVGQMLFTAKKLAIFSFAFFCGVKFCTSTTLLTLRPYNEFFNATYFCS